MIWIGISIGLVAGIILGVVVMCAIVISKKVDELEENE